MIGVWQSGTKTTGPNPEEKSARALLSCRAIRIACERDSVRCGHCRVFLPVARSPCNQARDCDRRVSCHASITSQTSPAFEVTSKRRKGYPSETNVKRGLRFVRGGEVELVEKLGRKDRCPCGSGLSFQTLLPAIRPVSTGRSGMIIGGIRWS